MQQKNLELVHVRGNTWVIKSWSMIPLYKIDEKRCILLDSGLLEQQAEIHAVLQKHRLTCVGILGSHAHMDHAGNHRFFQKTYGATVAMPLGEVGILASQLGMGLSIYNLSPGQISRESHLRGIECVADVIIQPKDGQVTLHGVTFDVIHTPGHSVDHIAIRTPDQVAYLGDAIMTGPTLFRAKFPYAFSMASYFESLRALASIEAKMYIASHFGVYPEIASLVETELAFLQNRMLELLALVQGDITVEDLAFRICQEYGIRPKIPSDMAYFERAARTYLHYLNDLGLLEAVLLEDRLRYRRTKIDPPVVANLMAASRSK